MNPKDMPPVWGCKVPGCEVDTQVTLCIHLETALFGHQRRNHPTRATWEEALNAAEPYYTQEQFDEEDFREFLAPYGLSDLEYGLLRDRYFIGLTGTTIAEEMGMPVSTINGYIAAIRKKLKRRGMKDIPWRKKK